MSLYGVEKSSLVNNLILSTRLTLAKARTCPNIRTLLRSFRQQDPLLTGTLPLPKFEKALNDNGIFWKVSQLQGFSKSTQSSQVPYIQFLQAIRVPMSPSRRNITLQIFHTISNNQPELPLETARELYNQKTCDNFERVSKSSVFSFDKWLAMLDTNGAITEQQFVEFYDDLNANFQSDQGFAGFICRQWSQPIAKTADIDPKQLQKILKSLQYKLIQKTNGTKDQFLLSQMFKEYANGTAIGFYELDLMLKRLQLPVAEIYLQPMVGLLDRNCSGAVQFQEFRRFVFFQAFVQ